MGIVDGRFDGTFKFVSGRGTNNSREERRRNDRDRGNRDRNANNNRQSNRNGRSIGDGGGRYRSSYLRDNDDYDYDRRDDKPAKLDNKTLELSDFCEDFYDADKNYRELQALIRDDLPEVIKAVSFYYGKNNSDEKMAILNRYIKIMCTSKFTNTFANIFESRVWLEDGIWDNIWRDIAFAISIALETNYERMHTDVVKKYVRDILPRIWQPDIVDITRQTGISKDLALDLLIAIPLANSNKGWTNAAIAAFYYRFLDKMIIHADDNMDILNWETQGMLFDKFFDKKSSTDLKVIGRYLVTEHMPKTNETVKDAVYDEFIKMLYTKLDDHDIRDISYCLEYVGTEMRRMDDANRPINNLIFSFRACKGYENIMKGLGDVIDNNPDAGKYLAN